MGIRVHSKELSKSTKKTPDTRASKARFIYQPISGTQATNLIESALEAFKEQIVDDDSIVEGEYFFPIFRCPRTELEANTLKRALEEDKSVWGNGDSSPQQFAESFGPTTDLALKMQDSNYFQNQIPTGEILPSEITEQENITFRQRQSLAG